MAYFNSINYQYDSPQRRILLIGIFLVLVALCVGIVLLFSSRKKNTVSIPVTSVQVRNSSSSNSSSQTFSSGFSNEVQLSVPIKIGVGNVQFTSSCVFNEGDSFCRISRNILNEVKNYVQTDYGIDNTVSFGPITLGKFQIKQIQAQIVDEPDVFSVGGGYLERIFEKVKVKEKNRDVVLVLSQIKDKVRTTNLEEIQYKIDEGVNTINDPVKRGQLEQKAKGLLEKVGKGLTVTVGLILLAGFILAQVLRVRGMLIITVGWFDTIMIIGGAVLLALYYLFSTPEASMSMLIVFSLIMWGISLVMSVLANIPNPIYIILSVVAKLFLFYMATLGITVLICIVIVWLVVSKLFSSME